MSLHRSQDFAGSLDKPSRRTFLAGTAALPLVAPALASASRPATPAADKPIFAYVGSYSSPEGPEGSKGYGQGIYLFEMDPATGALRQREVFPDASNPSCLAFDPSRTHLYAANETTTFKDTDSGSVSAFSIDRASGHLTLLNTVASEGAGPAYLSVHPSGRYVLVANYAGGTIAVLPIGSNGELGRATDIKQDQGQPGPIRATSAPPGSFAISGHDRPHAHMILGDPSGRFVLASDLALDRIFVWQFDVEKGALSPGDPSYVELPAGDGPRHFAFHPNERWMYSLQEEASTLVLFDYDGGSGALTVRQTVSTLPKEFIGTNFTSEVVVSANGRFVYAANRLHDTIALFSIGKNGFLTYAGETWTRGDYPRSFGIDPAGNFLYSCNQRSDAVTSFRIDRQTGNLTFTGDYTPVGTPAIILFLT